MIREFRLSPRGRGVACDEGGAFVGAIPLLKRTLFHDRERWEPRDCGELSKQVGKQFGLPIDFSSKAGGLKAISNALNEGNVARAQIATVLLAIPEPPALAKGKPAPDVMIKFIRDLYWSGMIKADWDSDEHPRWPAGTPDSQGGQFAPKGEVDAENKTFDSDAVHRNPEIQVAGTVMSDAVNDPVVEAARRAADAQRGASNARSGGSPVRSLGSRLWHEAESVFSQIGQAEVAESNANLAAANAETHAVAGWLRDLVNYSAKPWIGPDGRPVQIPIINTGDPNSDQGALIAHIILEPNAPLTRPGTNADWIDSLIGLASAGAMASRSALRPAGAEPPVAVEPPQPAIAKPFITLRSKLPPDFDASLPIGKFEVPENLIPGTKGFGDHAHDQIGALLQDAAGKDVTLRLNTAPNARGVDVDVPEASIRDLGFEYAEIKPLSRTGRSRFNNQVMNIWDLEGRVQAITYDKNGNIYYGFPGL